MSFRAHGNEPNTRITVIQPAPIALFVYNRPEKTGDVLAALAKNPELADSHLFIFCDGPRSELGSEQNRQIEATRAVVRSFHCPGKSTIMQSPTNKGLAESIKSGISTVLETYDSVIVIEDDIKVSVGFLKYMNAALRTFEEEQKVGAICAYIPEAPLAWTLPETFFAHHFTCWGWGTWKRVWTSLDWDASALLRQIDASPSHRNRLNFDGRGYFYDHLRDNACGILRTWAILFQSNLCLQEKLSLFPSQSLVQNIGCDGSGEHCGPDTESLHAVIPTNNVNVTYKTPEENKAGRAYFARFLVSGKENPAIYSLRRFHISIRRRIGSWRQRILSLTTRTHRKTRNGQFNASDTGKTQRESKDAP
jgi:hypothetical protein